MVSYERMKVKEDHLEHQFLWLTEVTTQIEHNGRAQTSIRKEERSLTQQGPTQYHTKQHFITINPKVLVTIIWQWSIYTLMNR